MRRQKSALAISKSTENKANTLCQGDADATAEVNVTEEHAVSTFSTYTNARTAP
jgi:hypothetical protein